jgi:type IV secretion system protein VirB2
MKVGSSVNWNLYDVAMVVTLSMIAVVVMAFLAPVLAHASSSGGGTLPWEGPLTTLENSIKGPVAFAVSIIGIVVCGAMLIWGGEINEFARRGAMLVLVIALLVMSSNVLSGLFTSACVVH